MTRTLHGQRAVLSTHALPTPNGDNIFDLLWEADSSRLTVSDKNENGVWRDPNADVLIDKQAKACNDSSCIAANGLIENPLFHTIRESSLSRGSFPLLLRLLDIYTADETAGEDLHDHEWKLIWSFIDMVLATPCMILCYRYVSDTLGLKLSKDQFRDRVFTMWFKLHPLDVPEETPHPLSSPPPMPGHTHVHVHGPLSDDDNDQQHIRHMSNHNQNQREDQSLSNDGDDDIAAGVSPEDASTEPGVSPKGARRVRGCSGFEHIFVGEVSKREGAAGAAMGMHYWLTFARAEERGVARYLGSRFGKSALSKLGAPFLSLKFRVDSGSHVFVKDKGSFFVGSSPEFVMAVATACFFEVEAEAEAEAAAQQEQEEEKKEKEKVAVASHAEDEADVKSASNEATPKAAHADTTVHPKTSNKPSHARPHPSSTHWVRKDAVRWSCRRPVGGFVYDMYLCKQQGYLVSSFQQLHGMTDDTKSKLTQLRDQARAGEHAVRMEKKRQRLRTEAEKLGLVTSGLGADGAQEEYSQLLHAVKAEKARRRAEAEAEAAEAGGETSSRSPVQCQSRATGAATDAEADSCSDDDDKRTDGDYTDAGADAEAGDGRDGSSGWDSDTERDIICAQWLERVMRQLSRGQERGM
jgi:hypothetical protein